MANNDVNTFELVVKSAASLPLVRIDRSIFLTKELSKYCSEEKVQKAVASNPAAAGIETELIDNIAKGCIELETNRASAISFAAGIPGGFAMIGTIPADLTQYYGHIIRILQKLIYLYGWQELFDDKDNMDDATFNLLVIFIGIMFGVDGAAQAISKVAVNAGVKAANDLKNKALTKTLLYPIVKKICERLGVKMTKEIFSKSVAKLVPIIGGFVTGGLTYVSFKPMAKRLSAHLSTLNLANPSFYEVEAEDA